MRVFISLIFFTALFFSYLGHAAPFHGLPYEVHPVLSQDGATLSLFHLKSNEDGPVVLLEPGLAETAETLDGIAHAYHQSGYNVYIGQVRLAGRGKDKSGRGVFRNGLEEVALFDCPAHLREVIRQTGGRPVHLFVHSMGGIEVLAMLSDDKLAAEFEPFIKGISLLTVPHDLRGLPRKIRLGVRLTLPLFKTVRNILGKATLGPHHTLFDFTLKMKGSKSPLIVRSAQAIEGWFVQLGTFILNRVLISTHHTSPEALRRLWFKELSVLPLDILIDMAEAVLDGEFKRRDGRPLIIPERIKAPVQVIRVEHDLLVPWKKQFELFKRLGSQSKRLVDLLGMRHVDPVIADQHRGKGFIFSAIEFHDALERSGSINFSELQLVYDSRRSDCASLLRAPTLQLRFEENSQ